MWSLRVQIHDTPDRAPKSRGCEHLRSRLQPFYRTAVPCDHYLYCVTVGFDFRYFVDFGSRGLYAEACVVIRNREELVRRLLAAMRERLPSWHVSFGMVKYVDPYSVVQQLPHEGDEIFYFKNFRYMYQREHRAIALPPAGVNGPFEERIPLELGSLTDIAELVVLNSPPI